jgi:hypothetical protein
MPRRTETLHGIGQQSRSQLIEAVGQVAGVRLRKPLGDHTLGRSPLRIPVG